MEDSWWDVQGWRGTLGGTQKLEGDSWWINYGRARGGITNLPKFRPKKNSVFGGIMFVRRDHGSDVCSAGGFVLWIF